MKKPCFLSLKTTKFIFFVLYCPYTVVHIETLLENARFGIALPVFARANMNKYEYI